MVKPLLCVVLGCAFVLACGGPDPGHVRVEVDPPVERVEPEFLQKPFLAEQIRDEWIEGFQVLTRRWTADAEVFDRWTVVRADADGADIESVITDEDGMAVGEPGVGSSTWVELRDHASFPAERATRESVVRSTTLGELRGWLYTVHNTDAATVSEFFFADDLPGAPVFVHVRRGGEMIEIFEQVERIRPGGD